MNANSPYLAAEDAAEVCRWHAERATVDARTHQLAIRQNIRTAHEGPPGSATVCRTAMHGLVEYYRRMADMLEADLDEQWAAKEARQREDAA